MNPINLITMNPAGPPPADASDVLIIDGNPRAGSFTEAVADAYARGAASAGAAVARLAVRELDFDPALHHGYHARTELEPDLLAATEALRRCRHLVLAFPVWWGSVPAPLKGFCDRVLLPGFAFTKHERDVWWDPHLAGRSARVVHTLDQPGWYYRLRYGAPTVRSVGAMTLRFCGFRPVRHTLIGPLRDSTPAWRERQLQRLEHLGRDLR